MNYSGNSAELRKHYESVYALAVGDEQLNWVKPIREGGVSVEEYETLLQKHPNRIIKWTA